MTDQKTKAAVFRSLHARGYPLLLANPWDAGSAKLLASLGFEALATTSAGVCFANGTLQADPRSILENCRRINAATDLPVTVDLENCFADDPAEAATMFARACEAGAVGGSIEDATGNRDRPIYEFDHAVARVEAAVEASRSLPLSFTLTARAEGLLFDRDSLNDVIRRLQAFEAAGADVLYAPGLKTIDQMRVVLESVSKPVNIVMGFADPSITLPELAEIGVRRISIGGGLARVALNAMMQAGREMRDGRFGFVRDMIGSRELREAFDRS